LSLYNKREQCDKTKEVFHKNDRITAISQK
jgi:hypothetical protein